MATRVLVVDRDRDKLTLMRVILAGAGHEVVCASDGTELEKALEEAPVNLVVAEASVPKLAPVELALQLKTHHCQDVPVLLVSTDVREGDRARRAMESKTELIEKPVRKDDLIGKVKLLLAGGGLRAAELPAQDAEMEKGQAAEKEAAELPEGLSGA